jgi:hypothetical protein
MNVSMCVLLKSAGENFVVLFYSERYIIPARFRLAPTFGNLASGHSIICPELSQAVDEYRLQKLSVPTKSANSADFQARLVLQVGVKCLTAAAVFLPLAFLEPHES